MFGDPGALAFFSPLSLHEFSHVVRLISALDDSVPCSEQHITSSGAYRGLVIYTTINLTCVIFTFAVGRCEDKKN